MAWTFDTHTPEGSATTWLTIFQDPMNLPAVFTWPDSYGEADDRVFRVKSLALNLVTSAVAGNRRVSFRHRTLGTQQVARWTAGANVAANSTVWMQFDGEKGFLSPITTIFRDGMVQLDLQQSDSLEVLTEAVFAGDTVGLYLRGYLVKEG